MCSKQGTNYLTIVAIILSLAALLTSIRGCDIANKAHELSVAQRTDNIWMGVHQKNEEILKLNPSNPKAILLKGEIQFHDKFMNGKLKLGTNNNYIRLKGIHYLAKEFILEKYKNIFNHMLVVKTEAFPMVVSAQYTIDGKLHQRHGVYRLEYDILPDSNNPESVDLQFIGMSFISEEVSRETAINILHSLWSNNMASDL